MRRSRRSVAVVALATALAAFPLGALASHQFADVPDSNPFHADISAIADAGVTSGCGGGNYCPSANVTREQMAAFMNRLGALGAGKTPVVNADKLDGLESGQFVRSDTVTTGHYNCTGEALVLAGESTGTHTWGTSNGRRTANWGTWACNVVLPDGATVTGVRFALGDTSASGEVQMCWLLRLGFADQDLQILAMWTGGTGSSETPGYAVYEANYFEPTQLVVDNELYTYAAQCNISGDSMTIVGYSVEYTLAGVAVP